MKKLFFLAVGLLLTASTHAQSTSGTWVDVTASPYNAKNDCSADAGAKINSAITNGPGNMVLFFPAGCYLISTQIVDTRTSGGTVGGYEKITYFGYGAEFQASTTTPPSNSIIKFGADTPDVTIRFRTIQGIYFNCNNDTIDGIDIDGLDYSEFDGITISQCKGTAAMRTVGSNVNNYSNVVRGGYIYAPGSTSGVLLSNNPTYSTTWTFYGTIVNSYGGGSTGVGIDFNGASGGVYGGDIENWAYGIRLGNSTQELGMYGTTISGTTLENNSSDAILLGRAGYPGSTANGVNIIGNLINCSNLTGTDGIRIEQGSGFTITGNSFSGCTSHAIEGLADGAYQGADKGFVGTNNIGSGQGILLQGSNNTVTSSLATKSANYTLSGADSWINVTGNTTITIPHAMTAQQWNVFNSGTGNVSLVCDSGTINGAISISIADQAGKTVTTDGTNCFAH